MSFGNLFLPPSLTLSDNKDQMVYQLQDLNARIAYLLNSREIGIYSNTQQATGQQWYLNTNQRQNGNRVVLNFGTLPNATSKSVAHGLTITNKTVVTNLYAVANDPVGFGYKKLPYVDCNTLANSIQLDMSQINITITTAANYSAYTTCYVVIEFLQT